MSQQGQLKFNIGTLTDRSLLLGGNLPLGQFVHVAATLNDATGAQRLYVNGTLAAETFTSVRPFRDLDAAFNPGVAIGHHAGFPTSPHNYAFHGRIDELSVYDQALTAEEVLAIYESSTDNNTKYYVVNDGTANRTYEYDATGAATRLASRFIRRAGPTCGLSIARATRCICCPALATQRTTVR